MSSHDNAKLRPVNLDSLLTASNRRRTNEPDKEREKSLLKNDKLPPTTRFIPYVTALTCLVKLFQIGTQRTPVVLPGCRG